MLCIVAATDLELARAAGIEHAELLACGVGPVAAAAAVAARLAREPKPTAILHVGIAGARRDGSVSVGDVVVGSQACYCDTTSRLIERVLEPDPALRAAVRSGLAEAHELPIGTSAQVGGTSGCSVEAMEGFAVLYAAQQAGVPAVEVRVISNEIEEEDRSRWQFDLALDRLAEILPGIVAAVDA